MPARRNLSISVSALGHCLLMLVLFTAAPRVSVAQEIADPGKGLATLKVFGQDERELVNDTTRYPWSTIGVVQAWWQKSDGTLLVSAGTGTLIGSRVVLTCGHCIYDSTRGLADGITFIPGRNGSLEPFGRSEAERSIVHSQWINGHHSQYDLAMIVLKTALGERTGHLQAAVKPASFFTGRNFNTAGYPGEELPGDQQYHAFGPTQGVDGNYVRHEIDSEPGQSGSPLWYYEPESDRRDLVGVLTGSRETRIAGQVVEVYNVAIHLNDEFGPWISETLAAHDSVSVDVPTSTGNDDTKKPSNVGDDAGDAAAAAPLCGGGMPGTIAMAIGLLGCVSLRRRRAGETHG